MKKILSASLGSSEKNYQFTTTFLKEKFQITRIGCDGDISKLKQTIRDFDGQVDAIGLGGISAHFKVAGKTHIHQEAQSVIKTAKKTPVADGRGLKTILQAWTVRNINQKYKDFFTNENVLFLSGIANYEMAAVLREYTANLSFFDPVIHFNTPYVLDSLQALEYYATGAMPVLTRLPYSWFYPKGWTGDEWKPLLVGNPFDKAEIIVGDFSYIRHYAPSMLVNKVVITDSVDDEAVALLKKRGVRTIITTVPQLFKQRIDINVLHAIFSAYLQKHPQEISENDYLMLIDKAKIAPQVYYPQGTPKEKHKFAFVIHPLSRRYLFKHPYLKWLEAAPKQTQQLVEKVLAYSPPFVYSHVTGIKSPTGVEAEGWLIALGATPEEMMSRDPEFTYKRLVEASEMAEKLGAKIMGLGAFTKIVGDAGVTVARRSRIPITSGNSCTASATLWAANEACKKMGMKVDSKGRATGYKAMVVGATGAIGTVCSRLLALVFPEIVLVAPRADKLLELKQTIENESKDTKVYITTNANQYISDMDLIVTTTSARGKKVLDIMKVKPGAVICDCARPLDISEEDAAKRPDVLVIESGELEVPGPVEFGGDIGLPPKTAYACLAETIILCLEGRYECFTLGRDINLEGVKEIYKMGLKHGFKLAAIRGHKGVITDQEIALVKARAEEALKERAIAAGEKAAVKLSQPEMRSTKRRRTATTEPEQQPAKAKRSRKTKTSVEEMVEEVAKASAGGAAE
ncbi:MAG: dehydrogenase [Acidobacteriota bacterium]|nr:dehydrogenase [Blastocatellia bacterium]MDW8411600.1 dehydrogenase [Acidobacteriota bacterium]